MREWFESWFGEEYVALYPHRDAADAEAAVALIERQVPISASATVLDLACGGGRHARLLSQRWATIGLDLSPVLLNYARTQAPEAMFVRGDMRILPFADSSFDVVVNLFTSFGYFADDTSHRRVIAEVARVMRRGGTFVLDFLNTEHIRDTLVPYDERNIGGQIVEQRRAISEDGRYVIKKISVRGQSREYTERVRMFDKNELTTMMKTSGFSIGDIFGSYRAEPLSDDSPRVIVFGARL